MARPNVLISIEATKETEVRSYGAQFMQSLLDEDPRLVPELVSTSERFRDPFVDLDTFVKDWWAIPIKTYVDDRLVGQRFGGPHWKRRSALANRGMVAHGLTNLKGQRTPSTLWFQSRWDRSVDFFHLFEAWVEQANPDIGMLHVFGNAELVEPRSNAATSFSVGSFGGKAKPGLPNMGWAMAYGTGFAHEVNFVGIENAKFPIHRVNDVVVVRITENLADVVENFHFFLKRRAELKQFFRSDLFWIREGPTEPQAGDSVRSDA